MNPIKILLITSFLLLPGLVRGQQTTRITGQVTDALTGAPMPFVSVVVPGTTVGISTGLDGRYKIETREAVTEVSAAYLSYESQSKPVDPGIDNIVDFRLVEIVNEIDAIVVTPGENPAHVILRNVSAHKKYNDPDTKEAFSYTAYTKMEVDLTDPKTEFKNRRRERNLGFIRNYIDTSALTGKTFLPVIITESVSDHYYRKSPVVSREVLKANRVSGIEEDFTFAQFTSQLQVRVNLYRNFIEIFKVAFASPLHDNGTAYYNYFLVDSTRLDGRKIYKIRFHPKSKATPVFDGEVNIDSETWALESASMRMIKELNLNWVRDMMIESRSQLLGDSVWFMKNDRIVADFAIDTRDSARFGTFMAQREVDYGNVRLDREIPPEIARLHNDVDPGESALERDSAFWEEARPRQLTQREREIYSMVDSLKNVKAYTNFTNLINTALFGYHNVGPVGFGPYYKVYSFNKLEGSRFQLGMRTNSKTSKKLRLTAYGAYGLRDKRWKGGGTVEYQFKTLPTSRLTASAMHDVLQLGATEDAYLTNNIMGSLFARADNNKLIMANQAALRFEQEWTEGVTNVFGLEYREMFPNARIDFLRPDGTRVDRIQMAEARIRTRFSKNEAVVRKDFEKLHIDTDFPIFFVDLTAGLKGVLNPYEYYKVEAMMLYKFNIPPLGRSELIVGGGKIFGKVPFTMLKLHEGNSTYLYDKFAFSCMDFFEFASDLWGSVMYEHHFRGFFFNRIPLLNKLKFREVLTAKMAYGSLRDRNNGGLPDTRAHLLFPQGMSTLTKPYVEVGCGVENILRLFRIDCVWRVTHRESLLAEKVGNFSVNFSFNLNF